MAGGSPLSLAFLKHFLFLINPRWVWLPKAGERLELKGGKTGTMEILSKTALTDSVQRRKGHRTDCPQYPASL